MQKLSIIVPVYNTEKTLNRCLNSILDEKNDNIEIIVINDGGTNNVDKYIDEYKLKYPDIVKYYSKPNTGIADTRNFGIEHATGNYIMFVDSDDYIDKSLLLILKQYLNNNIDIIKFKLIKVDEQENIIEKIGGPVFEITTGEEAFNNLYANDILIDSPCIYAFKKQLFTDKLKFKVGTEHEDFGLIPLLIAKAKSVISIDYYGYYYVQSSGSITRNTNYERNIKKMEDAFIHHDNMLEFLENNDLSTSTKNNLKQYYTNSIILKLSSLNKIDRKKYIKKINSKKMIKNIKVTNIKQLIKKIILKININWYLNLK